MKFEIIIFCFLMVLVSVSGIAAYLLMRLICWIAEKNEQKAEQKKSWKH